MLENGFTYSDAVKSLVKKTKRFLTLKTSRELEDQDYYDRKNAQEMKRKVTISFDNLITQIQTDMNMCQDEIKKLFSDVEDVLHYPIIDNFTYEYKHYTHVFYMKWKTGQSENEVTEMEFSYNSHEKMLCFMIQFWTKHPAQFERVNTAHSRTDIMSYAELQNYRLPEWFTRVMSVLVNVKNNGVNK